jgi:anti-sigma factor ChrR (cupin superfamily)
VETDPDLQPEDAPKFKRIVLSDLFRIAEHADEIAWEPFKPGVEIHRLYGNGVRGPTAALLRYRETSRVPLHVHPGFEHIIVLAGSQRDQNGTSTVGTLTINPPGTSHSVISEKGCIVLAVYAEAVQFTEGRRE